jgi:hypothetical protein
MSKSFTFSKGFIQYKFGIKFLHITEIILKDQQGKAAFNERNPKQQEPAASLIRSRLWFCSIWVCKKIISSNARYHTSPGFAISFKCFSHFTCRKSLCGSWGTVTSSTSKNLSPPYATRISSNSKHPAKNIIFNPSYTEKFVNKPKEIKPLGLRLQMI